MADTRKQFTAEQKIAILRRHLVERIPVSDLCDEYGVAPSVFYRWQQQLFENGAAVFAPPPKGVADPMARKVSTLEEKLARKNEVLSELMEEYVKLKKALGGA